jgi:hypothetical protein
MWNQAFEDGSFLPENQTMPIIDIGFPRLGFDAFMFSENFEWNLEPVESGLQSREMRCGRHDSTLTSKFRRVVFGQPLENEFIV